MASLRGLALTLIGLVGIGYLSKAFKAGVGLGELGTGMEDLGGGVYGLMVSPMKATGMGLGYMGGGISSMAQGLKDLFSVWGGRPDDRNGNGASTGNGTGGHLPGETKMVNGIMYVWDLVSGGGWGWRSLSWTA